VIQRVQRRDPLFLRKVFVSHYCNIPFHLLDRQTQEDLVSNGVYPKTLIEEIYAGAYHLIRNFELAPFAHDTSLEDLIAQRVENGDL
jgi:hypothetical protein